MASLHVTDILHFPPPPRPPDRRRHGAGVEWLPPHGGVSVWGGVWAVGHATRCRAGFALRLACL